jgi:RNA polymerase sigma factor (sigma-70 family)
MGGSLVITILSILMMGIVQLFNRRTALGKQEETETVRPQKISNEQRTYVRATIQEYQHQIQSYRNDLAQKETTINNLRRQLAEYRRQEHPIGNQSEGMLNISSYVPRNGCNIQDDDLLRQIDHRSNLLQLKQAIRKTLLDYALPVGDIAGVLRPNYQESLDDAMYNEALRQTLELCFAVLTTQERLILTMRFGLNGNDPMTYKEVGEALGIRNNTVRDHEMKALRKLRHPTRSTQIRQHLT